MKSILFILGLLIVGTVAVIAFIFYQNYQVISEAPELRSIETTVTRDSISLGLTSFIRGSQISEDEFVARYRCEDTGCTEMLAASTTAFGYAIRGLLASAEITDDPQTRIAADLPMEHTLLLCENDPGACERNFFALQSYYEMTGDESYKSALLTAADRIMDVVENNGYSEILAESDVYRKLEYLYELTGDAKYRDLVVAAAEELMAKWPSDIDSQIVYETDDYAVSYHMPLIANGLLLPAYRITGDAIYLDAATEFFAEADISKFLSVFRWAGGTAAVLNTLEGLITLSESDAVAVPERASFEAEAKEIMAQLVGWQYDAPERVIYTGDHGFVTGVMDLSEFPDVNYKSLDLNGWIALLLAEEIFEGEIYPLYVLP